MRTLSAELTTAQQSAAYSPYMSIALTSRDGVTSLSYNTDSSPNRILRVRSSNSFYGGTLFEVQDSGGQVVPVACQIILSNHDNEFTSKDLRGYKVEIGWGFSSYVSGGSTTNIAGDKTSPDEPFFVLMQKDIIAEGQLVTELLCVSAWHYLVLQSIMSDPTGDVYTATGSKIRHIIFDALTFAPDKVLAFESSSFTDRTSEATDNTNNFTLDMAAGDILYIGVLDQVRSEIDRISIEMDTEGLGTWDVAYEYSTAAGWSALSGVDDQTSEFTDGQDAGGAAVPKVLSFTKPSDWDDQTINSLARRWIRIRVTSSTTVTTKPSFLRIGVSRHWGFQVDDSDVFENASNLMPELEATIDTSRLEILRRVLDLTQSGLIMGDKYFKLVEYAVSPVSTDYDYDLSSGHTFFVTSKQQSMLVPNQVTATNILSNGPTEQTRYVDSFEDSDAIGRAGVIPEIIVDPNILDATDALLRATRRLNLYKQQISQGEVSIPMNIGQEPWDWIGITDSRTSQTITGRVGRIIREYNHQESSYQCLISLGEPRTNPIQSLSKARNQVIKEADLLSVVAPLEPLADTLGPFGDVDRPLSLPDFGVPRRNTFTLPGVPNVPDHLGFDLDAGPYQISPVSATFGYRPPKLLRNPESVGESFGNTKHDVIYLRDFTQGGYRSAVLHNSGDGALRIADATGGGTALDIATVNLRVGIGTTSIDANAQLEVEGKIFAVDGTAPSGVEGFIEAFHQGQNTPVIRATATDGTSFADTILQLDANRGSSSAYSFIKATRDVDGTPVVVFEVKGDGSITSGRIVSPLEISGIDGIDFYPGSAVDTSLLTVQDVGHGPPELKWDDSETAFNFNEDVVVNASLRVGNTDTAPGARLHVSEGSHGGAVPSSAEAVFENDGDVSVYLLSPAANHGIIYFGDADDDNIGIIVYDHFDETMAFHVNVGERVRIDGAGDVAIGTTTTTAKLTVSDEDFGGTIPDAELVVEDNADAYIYILTPNSSMGSLMFGDPQDDDVGAVGYFHATDTMQLTIAGSLTVTISATDFQFFGAHSISTGSGDLTITPKASLILNPQDLSAVEITNRNGLLIGDGTDADVTLITVDILTGSPTLIWDESESQLYLDTYLRVSSQFAVTNPAGDDGVFFSGGNMDFEDGGIDTTFTNFGIVRYADFNIDDSADGGFRIRGMTGSSGGEALYLEGYSAGVDGGTGSTVHGVVIIDGSKEDGTGGGTSLSSNDVILTIETSGNPIFILQADGDGHAKSAGTWQTTSWDDYDDVALIRDINQAAALGSSFGDFIKYNRDIMENTGLIKFESDGSYWLNFVRFHHLTSGAIWQMHQRIQSLEQELRRLQSG